MSDEKQVDKQIEQLYDEDVTKGDRHWARMFTSVYTTVRPSLVLLNKARRNKYKGGAKGKRGELVTKAQVTNKEACERLKEVLGKAYESLE